MLYVEVAVWSLHRHHHPQGPGVHTQQQLATLESILCLTSANPIGEHVLHFYFPLTSMITSEIHNISVYFLGLSLFMSSVRFSVSLLDL